MSLPCRRFGFSVSADDCSLLPPPNGSSMAMQINARTHSEPFMATRSRGYVERFH